MIAPAPDDRLMRGNAYPLQRNAQLLGEGQ